MNTSEELSEEDKKNLSPIRLFMFRVWIDDQETLLSFTHSDRWDRAIVILQLSRLYPEAKKFKLFDGTMEIEFDNTEEDVNQIIHKLNHPEQFVEKAD